MKNVFRVLDLNILRRVGTHFFFLGGGGGGVEKNIISRILKGIFRTKFRIKFW